MYGKDSDPVWARQLGLFFTIAVELVVTTGIGIGSGYWAWMKWGAPIWILIFTTSASLVLAMYRIYFLFKKKEPK